MTPSSLTLPHSVTEVPEIFMLVIFESDLTDWFFVVFFQDSRTDHHGRITRIKKVDSLQGHGVVMYINAEIIYINRFRKSAYFTVSR